MLAEERMRGHSPEAPHNIILEDRSKMSVSGVEDVESFDDASVVLFTTRGVMTVTGSGLHIDRLSLETGEVSIEGMIEGVHYSDEQPAVSFWSRLFR